MGDECPNCGCPSLGGTIVEFPKATTKTKVYGVVCPNCNVIYQSTEAEKQVNSTKVCDWK
jgi:hypothetical protein